MKVSELICKIDATEITLPEGDREISGCYIGDLLSWVMGRAEADNVWITIMSNINTVAVASLSDVSLVLLAEGVTLDGDVKAAAEAKGINVASCSLPAYEIAVKLSQLL
ncbi:MAG: hypothetical protein E7660_02775 [Ruminococcaceae bacterium]|nr:hypothetical protein [Oscillospiraceae bacterium]